MKARIPIWLALVVLISYTAVVEAVDDSEIPDGTIYGHVYDADTKQPLSQAFVYCQEVRCSKPVTTNATGYYATDPCFSPSKTYTFHCTKHGYQTATKSVTMDQSGKALADFDLFPGDSKQINAQANQIPLNSSSAIKVQGDAEAWVNKGRDFQQFGKYTDALDAYNRAIEIDPNFAEAWEEKGINLLNLGKDGEAILAIDKAIEINPKSTGAWYLKADLFASQNKTDEAIEAFTKVIEINPQSPQALVASYDKASTLMEHGKYDEALKTYDEAIAMNPNSADNTLINKGYALNRISQYDKALQTFDLAIAINPRDATAADAWDGKGDTFCLQNKYDEAVKCYNEAIRIYPDSGIAWSGKGLALQKLGRTSEADAAFAKVEELKSSGKFIEADFQTSSK